MTEYYEKNREDILKYKKVYRRTPHGKQERRLQRLKEKRKNEMKSWNILLDELNINMNEELFEKLNLKFRITIRNKN